MKSIQESIEIRQLAPGDILSHRQLEDIAGLIYDTDPYIYPAIFGCRSNALIILPELMTSGRDSMFNLSNIYASISADRVFGIILWHKGPVEWDPETMLNIAVQKSVDLDDKQVRRIARSYFGRKYDDPGNEGLLLLINVCVSLEYRGRGIASGILSSFIGEHDSESMELCVIAGNDRAVVLYRNNGFFIIGLEDGFSLDEDKPQVYSMRREPDRNTLTFTKEKDS